MQHFTGSIHGIKSDWDKNLKPFSVSSDISQTIFSQLVAAYSTPTRFYHNLNHIQQVLLTIEEISQQDFQLKLIPLDFSIIRCAAWFHDVIYNSKSDNNEKNSANYAQLALKQLPLPIAMIERVKVLILATEITQVLPKKLDSQILRDADLAILGATEINYQAYTKAIRQEYAWIPEPVYRLKRKQILQHFIQQKQIYLTPPMFRKYEAIARHNLQIEISFLSSECET